jgi:hypothetical protein
MEVSNQISNKTSKARQCLARSASLQATPGYRMYKSVMMKSMWQRMLQEVGNVSIMPWPQEKKALGKSGYRGEAAQAH